MESHSHVFKMEEHTADIKMRVYGNTLPELFKNAAYGMMHYLYGENPLHSITPRYEHITLAAADTSLLLVDWLSELLALSDIHHEIASTYRLHTLSDTQLDATVGFCPAHSINDIKAVTYHDLKIHYIHNGYEATLVFDI